MRARAARRAGWIAGALLGAIAVFATAFWLSPVTFFQHYAGLRLRLAGAESRSIVIKGIRVHYFALGREAGAPVVLVHGLGGRSEDWQGLAPSLARAGYRVYLPDLPGYGQSEKPAQFSYSVLDEAAVVVAFLDALGLKKVDLGGWSMGGWIAQHIAIKYPDRIGKLMLFDSAGLAVRPGWNTGLFTPANAEELAELDALLMPHPPTVPGFVARDILRISRQNAWIVRRALASMLTGRDATDSSLPALKMPVLLEWGAEDHITPVEQGQRMHALMPQSQLEILPGCGHLAPNQCAAEMAPTVEQFLGR